VFVKTVALKEILPPAKSTATTFYHHSIKYRPSKPQNFGDGGAFSEIHYAQYPLDMGRKKDSNSGLKTLPVTVLKDDEMDHEEDNDKQKEIEETTEQTKAALEKIYPMSILLPYIYFPM
ncbi:SNW domain-containing protein 1, partial [Tanacetum coccineum]